MEEQKDLTKKELKEIRHRKRALKKKRMKKKKELEKKRMRTLLEDGEKEERVETPEERRTRLYAKAQKKMTFAPHMYRREDQADMYRQAAELFGETAGYEESDALREKCLKKAKKYRALYIEETYALINEQLAGAETLIDCRKIQENIDALADFKDMEFERKTCEDIERRLLKKEQNKKIVKTFLSGVILLAVLFVIIYVQGTIQL